MDVNVCGEESIRHICFSRLNLCQTFLQEKTMENENKISTLCLTNVKIDFFNDDTTHIAKMKARVLETMTMELKKNKTMIFIRNRNVFRKLSKPPKYYSKRKSSDDMKIKIMLNRVCDWIAVDVCNEYVLGNCTKDQNDCVFAHPFERYYSRDDGETVVCCEEFLKVTRKHHRMILTCLFLKRQSECDRAKCCFFHVPCSVRTSFMNEMNTMKIITQIYKRRKLFSYLVIGNMDVDTSWMSYDNLVLLHFRTTNTTFQDSNLISLENSNRCFPTKRLFTNRNQTLKSRDVFHKTHALFQHATLKGSQTHIQCITTSACHIVHKRQDVVRCRTRTNSFATISSPQKTKWQIEIVACIWSTATVTRTTTSRGFTTTCVFNLSRKSLSATLSWNFRNAFFRPIRVCSRIRVSYFGHWIFNREINSFSLCSAPRDHQRR